MDRTGTMDFERLVNQEFIKGMAEGEEGRIRIKELWGFDRVPFSGEEPPREVFLGREDEVSRLARALGRSMMDPGGVIACIGPVDSGVTTTLRVVYDALQESEKVLGVFTTGTQLMETYEREEDGEEYLESYFDLLLEETDFLEVRYIIIDDADEIVEYVRNYVRRIKESAGAFNRQPAILLGLHLSGWISMPSDFRGQIAEQVWLLPLETERVVGVLQMHLAWARGSPSLEPFDDTTIQAIAERSGGLPGLALYLARLALRECVARECEGLSLPLVGEVAQAYGFSAVDLIAKWELSEDETRAVVIEHIVRRPSGIHASGLADVTSISRTTISYHLAALDEMGVLAKQRRGHRVLYVPTEVARAALEVLVLRKLSHGMGLKSWKKAAG